MIYFSLGLIRLFKLLIHIYNKIKKRQSMHKENIKQQYSHFKKTNLDTNPFTIFFLPLTTNVNMTTTEKKTEARHEGRGAQANTRHTQVSLLWPSFQP